MRRHRVLSRKVGGSTYTSYWFRKSIRQEFKLTVRSDYHNFRPEVIAVFRMKSGYMDWTTLTPNQLRDLRAKYTRAKNAGKSEFNYEGHVVLVSYITHVLELPEIKHKIKIR